MTQSRSWRKHCSDPIMPIMMAKEKILHKKKKEANK
jgi:hypothetical protein